MRRIDFIQQAEPYMNRIATIVIRLALAFGLGSAILYYALLARGTMGGAGLFFPGDIGRLLNLHDILSLLLMGYWFLLIIRFPRMNRPLVPFAVFFFHTVVEPYLLLSGEAGANSIRTARFIPYYLSYPIALLALTLWLALWLFSRPHAVCQE